MRFTITSGTNIREIVHREARIAVFPVHELLRHRTAEKLATPVRQALSQAHSPSAHKSRPPRQNAPPRL
jgi:hypothetical protein